MSAKILVIDDEPSIREMVRFALERSGYEIYEAGDTRGAQLQIAEHRPDLLLLDWMLPDMSGVDFARRLKKEADTAELPIIMLTARAEEDDKIRGLESGADDYITKPFSPRELMARIKAVLRRLPGHGQNKLNAEGLELDLESHRVTAKGQTVELGPTEFRLLQYFISHPDRVYSRTQLLDQVWGSNVYVEERTVDVHIRRLRKALEESGYDRFIQTIRSAGYRFSTRGND
ncbi:MAG: phosphate regulon transcriptional regulator PhoB [Gammaproteobacteria bacterium]|nr:phosphate regulon transcriptional regulator PhoB [Gammaproteobacteria bacterium]